MRSKLSIQKVLATLVFISGFFISNLSAQNCNNRVFNINVLEKVTILEVINQLSDSCEFSVIVKDPIASKLVKKNQDGINIKNLSLNKIFELLILDNNMFYSFEDTVLKISALETKTFKVDYITSTRKGSTVTDASAGGSGENASSDVNKITTEESFDFWDTISAEVMAILNSGEDRYVAKKPIINKNAGMVTITATKQQLNRVGKYLTNLENRLHKQVLIEVKIISITLDNSYSSGIDWSEFGIGINQNSVTMNNLDGATTTYNPGNTFASSVDATGKYYKLAWNNALNLTNVVNFTMKGLFNFLDEQGESKIVSSPKILTLNNQQALISVGSNINYQIKKESTSSGDNAETAVTFEPESIFIGILLNILPEISDDNEIILRINPTISGFKYGEDNSKQVSAREIAPDTQEKKLSTVVKVRDGETIILGGLITSSDGLDEKGIPVLKDIPILGRLFGYTKKTDVNEELIFVITPKIIQGHYNHDASLRSLGYSKKAIVSE